MRGDNNLFLRNVFVEWRGGHPYFHHYYLWNFGYGSKSTTAYLRFCTPSEIIC